MGQESRGGGIRVWVWAKGGRGGCVTHKLVQCFGDELSLAVDAGVGALPGDLLLLLRDAAGRRGATARVQRAWGGQARGGGAETGCQEPSGEKKTRLVYCLSRLHHPTH